MLQELASSDVTNTRVANEAKNALEAGTSAMATFLQKAILAVQKEDEEELSELFREPNAIAPLLMAKLQAMDDAQSAAAFSTRLTRELSDASGDDALTQRFLRSTGGEADGEEFGDTATGAMDLNEGYLVFGLFRSTAFKEVLRDAVPLYVVTWYSIWDIVTRRMLGLMLVRTILVSKNTDGVEAKQESRWLYDMRYKIFGGDHLYVGLVGVCGLLVWSISFLALLFWKLRSNRHRLQEMQLVRGFGYFYNGYEPKVYWWEILVKKADILVLYVVTFTELFPDPRAKLILFLGVAGIAWSMHNLYNPFDDRQNRLADRLENAGLGVRFGTLFLLQLLLMLDAPFAANAVIAGGILALNAWFMVTAVFLLTIEIPDLQSATGDDEKLKAADAKLKEKTKAKAMDWISFGEHPLTKALSKALNFVVAKLIGPIIGWAVKVFLVAAETKVAAAKRVPHLRWQGIGLGVVLQTHERVRLRWYERFLCFFLNRLYRLDDEGQKLYLARTIGKFWDYVLNNSECDRLPSCIMDIFFALPDALKKEKLESTAGEGTEFHVSVARRVRETLKETHSLRQPSMRSTLSKQNIGTKNLFSKATGTTEHGNSAEELGAVLMFMQRLPKMAIKEFIQEALLDEELEFASKPALVNSSSTDDLFWV